MLQEPFTDVFVIFCGRHRRLKFIRRDALEREQHRIKHATKIIFTQCARDTGPAFIHDTLGDDEARKPLTRAGGCLFGQVTFKYGRLHDCGTLTCRRLTQTQLSA